VNGYGCWFSFFNGFTQSAQNYYPMQVLGVSLFLSLSLQTGMRLGQLGISPWIGALADRIGNRPVMIASQLVVAAGLLFFAAATPAHWSWLIGAWVLWIAYAGLNVCLPNLMLKLSPERSNSPYIAAYYAITGLCYAASTIVGGALVDQCRTWTFPLGGFWLGFFPCLFLCGWAMRSLGSLLLLLVIEPPAKLSQRGRKS
jgi:MFS family permease